MWLVLALEGGRGWEKSVSEIRRLSKTPARKKTTEPRLAHRPRPKYLARAFTNSRELVSSLMGRCCITLIKVVKKTTNPNAKGTCKKHPCSSGKLKFYG